MSIKPSEVIAYCEGATEGPWIYHQRSGEIVDTPDNPEDRFDVIEMTLLKAVENDADGEFVTQARTDLPALAAFAEAVLALHRAGAETYYAATPWEPRKLIDLDPERCRHCREDYPCPTVQLATEHGIAI